jgi:hypothetical protein
VIQGLRGELLATSRVSHGMANHLLFNSCQVRGSSALELRTVPQFAVDLLINIHVVHSQYLSVCVLKPYPIDAIQNTDNAALNSYVRVLISARKKIALVGSGGGV